MKYFPIWLIVLVVVSCGERSVGVVHFSMFEPVYFSMFVDRAVV